MVNANQARPLAAFWLLAIVAAVITGAGLRADHSPAAERVASPAPVSSSAAPELVLGGVLRARSDLFLSRPLSPDLWESAAAGTPVGGPVQVAAPSRPASTHKARTKSGGAQQTNTAQAQASQTTTQPATTVSTSHGKGHDKSDQTAKTTTTATATATPTAPGKSAGKGNPVDPEH